jgi:hypothetical protein
VNVTDLIMKLLVILALFAVCNARTISDKCENKIKRCITENDIDGKFAECEKRIADRYACFKDSFMWDKVSACVRDMGCMDSIIPKQSPSPKPTSCPEQIDPKWKDKVTDRIDAIKTVKRSSKVWCKDPVFDNVCQTRCWYIGSRDGVEDYFVTNMQIDRDAVFLMSIKDFNDNDVCMNVRDC